METSNPRASRSSPPPTWSARDFRERSAHRPGRRRGRRRRRRRPLSDAKRPERRETPTELHRGTPTLAAGLVGARFSGKKRKSTGEATPRTAAMPPTMTKTPASNRGTPTVAAQLVGARFSGKRRASGNAGSGRALKGVAALVDVEGAGTSPGAAAALVASRFSGKKRESSGANATTIPVEGDEGGIPTTMTKTPASNRGTPTLAAELVGARFSGKRRKSSLADANAAGAVSPGAARPSPSGSRRAPSPRGRPRRPLRSRKKDAF